MTFVLPDEFLLTAMQAAEACALPYKRVAYLLSEHPEVAVRTSDKKGAQYRIAYKDLNKLNDLDLEHRRKGRVSMATRSRITVLQEQVSDLTARVEFLENAFDHYTAPDLEQVVETR